LGTQLQWSLSRSNSTLAWFGKFIAGWGHSMRYCNWSFITSSWLFY